MWRPEVNVRSLPQIYSTIYSKSLTRPELTDLAKWARQNAPVHLFISTLIIGTFRSLGFLCWCWWWIQVLMLVQQTLYPLTHSSAMTPSFMYVYLCLPVFLFFKFFLNRHILCYSRLYKLKKKPRDFLIWNFSALRSSQPLGNNRDTSEIKEPRESQFYT